MSDRVDLSRFLDAQARDFPVALSEIKAGRKQSHWMWYIFPQIAGLARSPMSVRYAIQDLQEAKAYLRHPLLGANLKTICEALLALPGRNATVVLGTPDDLKLRSSMTLFAEADPTEKIFKEVIEKYFNSMPDPETLKLLKRG